MTRRAVDHPAPVARSLRLRAVAREKEIDRAWKVLEHFGFRPEAVGLAMPQRQLRGRLPDAIGKALRCVTRERDRERRRMARLAAKLNSSASTSPRPRHRTHESP